MITIDTFTAAIVALVLALWLAAAIAATVLGLRRAARAQTAIGEGERLAELLAGAPAIPLLISGEGRIQADERLAGWLGLERMPRYLADLAGGETGLTAADAADLAREVAAVQRSGRRFFRTTQVQRSGRVLGVHGRPSVRAGRVILLFFDATDTREEIDRLTAERRRLTTAIEALSALIEAAPFPMWHRGPDLRLALVNAAYVRAVEARSAADVVARGLELVEGHEGKGPLAAAAAAREAGEASIRNAPATIGGERRMIRVVDVPLGDAGIAGYAIDIEELEEARADLGRFARAQRDMLDNLSAGVAQFGPDRHLVFSNQPFQRLFAIKPEWVADRPEFDRVLERMREAGRLPESRDFPGWKAERRAWFFAENDPIEENWLLPGGAHLRVLAQPLPDGGLLLIFEDRTEQVQLASARDTLLRVRTATFDNLFEAIGVFAADGRLHLWNNRFRDVWGLSEEELAAHPRVDALAEAAARRLVNPSRAGLIRELVRIATAERQQRSGRVSLIDGRHFEFAAVPLPDGNALFTMLDVTDSRRIERALRDRNEALEDADRLKTAFVANMSYELRTPLTSIGGFAEMLAADYAGPLSDQAREYVAAIMQSVSHLSALIDDVLDLSQGEAGSLPMDEEPVDLVELANEAAQAVQEEARARPLDLVLRIDPSVGTVTGDARRLRQAFDHLLRSAITHTPAGGRVLFHADGDAEAAELVVSDNGDGLSAEERERILGRGGRGDNGPADLGFPLARQFVEAHGGTISLLSEPGQGTTLIVRLPRKR